MLQIGVTIDNLGFVFCLRRNQVKRALELDLTNKEEILRIPATIAPKSVEQDSLQVVVAPKDTLLAEGYQDDIRRVQKLFYIIKFSRKLLLQL